MADSSIKVTVAAEVVLPREYVTLKHLRAKDGSPVVVGCAPSSDLALATLLSALPGFRDGQKKNGEGHQARKLSEIPKEELEAAIAEAAENLRIAPKVIELGTFLLDADGQEIRPAFKWGSDVGRSIPGEYLKEEDQVALMEGVLKAGGYLGGAADSASFHVDGEGGDGGLGVVARRKRRRKDPGGGAAGPGPSVQPQRDASAGQGPQGEVGADTLAAGR